VPPGGGGLPASSPVTTPPAGSARAADLAYTVPSDDLSELVAALAGHDDIFPLGRIPQPPAPLGRSQRLAKRHRLALEAWSAAERTRAALDTLYMGAPHFAGTTDLPVPPRRILRGALATGGRDRVYRVLLEEGARLARARRESMSSAPTGDALLARILHHTLEEVYAGTCGTDRYVPFKAAL
jgi:hypothetical protein